MAKVEVERAGEIGFCFGVRRAIQMIEAAAREQSGIATLGPVVHNQRVVAKLSGMGVSVVTGLDQFHGGIIAITSHGVSPELMSQIETRQLPVIDTTCPIVHSAQKAARDLAEAGFGVVIFGEASHPEVRGLLGWAGSGAIATLDGGGVADLTLPRRLGILAQTTQSRSRFTEFASKVVSAVFPHIQELRVIDTLCRATQKRQEAALDLADRTDLMIVVGGRNSANTQRLAEACSPAVETYAIETADEIQRSWLAEKQHIAVTGGTSTPEEAIEEVVVKLESLARGAQNP